MKIGELRKKYPTFVYKRYSYALQGKNLHMSFDFEVPASSADGGEIKFQPQLVIKNVSKEHINRAGESTLENLVFHLGLAEMPSYWKATASPNIIIEAGTLSRAQINWWHDLFMRGMGQYFYEDNIDFTKKGFLTIEATEPPSSSLPARSAGSRRAGEAGLRRAKGVLFTKKLSKRTLVPIGGGKDAIVTYELLKQAGEELRSFILNPKKEHTTILRKMEEGSPVVALRTIDSKLLELNRKGYLNGHTPFSAYLAFLTTLCAMLFDYKYIALSNERSSNEGNVEYLGKTINHQYSKSFDFEEKFRLYSKKYLASELEYFSFLRPLYELQIAKLFSNYPQYFATFLSCNEAHKTASGTQKTTGPPASQARALRAGKWCRKCSKCLFVFASLYPFVQEKQLVKTFGANLLEDRTLIPLMEELVGERNFKPFECVGTTKESLVTFYLALQKHPQDPPTLLEHFKKHILPKHKNLAKEAEKILSAWNNEHFIPRKFVEFLKTIDSKIAAH